MGSPYSRAPHVEGVARAETHAPNAALLIDFDNVTMGMRSDLSKELKNLLQTDVIKGKVTVQRAYADWRRYPQYIVPLSEASVDLIFAPAYGSSKKNATDIRMAIDGIELVFIRPEIGTFILLTGDSDFSSLVLKLKEYGKYVIGVGIQESSSDILVQNCDEYYSYTSLSGLTKASDSTGRPMDPWELVEQAVTMMVKRGDVMRSDRLKQVMIEIDGSFGEGNFGFSKFSKFLAEAASRKLIRIHKLENGQYEILVDGKAPGRGREDRGRGRREDSRSRRGGRGRGERSERSQGRVDAREVESSDTPEASESTAPAREYAEDPLEEAYQLLAAALEAHAKGGRDKVRDSDVKRKILELSRDFDEGELGFGKFSRFLHQALQHGVIEMERVESGNQVVSLASGKASGGARLAPEAGTEPVVEERKWELVSGKGTRSFHESDEANRGSGPRRSPRRQGTNVVAEAPTPVEQAVQTPTDVSPQMAREVSADLSDERSGEASGEVYSTAADEISPAPTPTSAEPPFDGPPDASSDVSGGAPTKEAVQTPEPSSASAMTTPSVDRPQDASPQPSAPARGMGRGGGRSRKAGGVTFMEGQIIGAKAASPAPSVSATLSDIDLATLGLPREGDAIVQYLTNSYKGVGEKTARQLVDEFGAELFEVLHRNPDRLRAVVPRRADQLLEGWRADFDRRTSASGEGQ